jgi:putative hemolysin
MAITSILIQPDASSINSAYRPIILRVLASSNNIGVPNPPVVYCDIYINGTFYKTITRTQYAQLSLTDSQWEI